MDDNISKLYNELKSTYDVGSEDDFRKYLDDSNNREKLRKELESTYDVGDSSNFDEYLGYNSGWKQHSTEDDAPGAPLTHGAVSGEDARGLEKTAEDAGTASGKTAGAAIAGGEAAPRTQKPVVAKKQKGYKPSPSFLWNLHSSVNAYNEGSRRRKEQVRRMTMPATTEGRKELKTREFGVQLAGGKTKLAGVVPGKNNAPQVEGEGNESTAPTTGPVPYGTVMENGKRVTQWMLPDGRLTTDIAEAEYAEGSAREARLAHAAERRANDPEAQVADADKLQSEIEEMLDEERQKLNDMAVEDAMENPFLSSLVTSQGGDITDMRRYNKTDIGNLEVAKRTLEDTKRMVNEAAHNEEGRGWLESSFGAGLARGLWDNVTDRRTWDLGITDLQDATLTLSALDAFDKGKKLTPSQQKLLDAKATQIAIEAWASKNVGWGYDAGAVTAQAIPFMVEMCLNPAATTGELAANKMARYVVKRYGKEAVKRNAKKYVAAKVATRVLGDIAGAGIMSATTGLGRVAAEATRLQQGDIKYDFLPDGRVTFGGHENAKSAGDAWGKAFVQHTIENQTEMAGAYFSAVGGVIGHVLSKTPLKKLGAYAAKWGRKITPESVIEFVKAVPKTEWAKGVKKFQKLGKYDGLFGEYGEEVLGNVENAIIYNDDEHNFGTGRGGVFNLEDNLKTFVSLIPMQVVFGGVSSVGYWMRQRESRKRMEKLGNELRATMSEEDLPMFETLQSNILGNDNGAMVDAIYEALTRSNMSYEQRRLLLNYAKSAMGYKTISALDDEEMADTGEAARQVRLSYDAAYTREMDESLRLSELAAEKYGDAVGLFLSQEEIAKMDEDPIAWLRSEAYRALPGWRRRIAEKYINARASMVGAQDRVRDELEGRVDEASSTIDGRTNKSTGNVQRATMRHGDREVYVVDGDVTMLDDGSDVDKDASSESVIIKDAQTGRVEMVSIGDISSVDAPISAEDAKASAKTEIEAEMEDETTREQGGFEQGSRVPIADGRSIEIVQDNGDTCLVRERVVDAKGNVTFGEATETTKENLSSLREDFLLRGVMALSQRDESEMLRFEVGEHFEAVTNDPDVVGSFEIVSDNGDGTVTYKNDAGEEFVAQKSVIQWAVNDAYERGLVEQAEDETQTDGAEVQGDSGQVDGVSQGAPEYALNDEVVLDVDGTEVRGMVTAEADEDGMIEVTTESPIGGKVVNLFSRDELDAMSRGRQGTSEDGIGQSAGDSTGSQMPTKVVDGKSRVDYMRATPQRGAQHIYDEKGYSEAEADEMVANTIAQKERAVAEAEQAVAEAQAELDAVGAERPTVALSEDSEDEYLAQKADIDRRRGVAQQKVASAQSALDAARHELTHWQAIRDAAQKRKAQSAEVQSTESTGVQSTEGQGAEVRSKVEEEQPNKSKYELSNEVDENGRQFVLTSEGNLEFGEISADTGLPAAPILLSEGMITNPETNDGYGLVHIEARHGDQIRKAGYDSVVDFVEEVAKNYEVIREGNLRDGIKTYMLQLTDKHNNTLMVELSGDGTYWNINTAGIFKTSYGAKRNVVYNRHTTAKQSAETAEASLSGEQGGTTPSTSMNAPTQTSNDVSVGKGSENSETGKGESEKSGEGGDVISGKPIQGLDGRSEEEVLAIVRDHIEEVLSDEGVDGVTLKGMALHGSRLRGDAKEGSDLDVVVEFDGDMREDDMFNMLNADSNRLSIDGISVDINPIREDKSGTLERYMERSRKYDESKGGRERTEEDERGQGALEAQRTEGQKYGSEEEEAIERKAKADGSWLTAPNGERSRLAPRQWVQTRTKAFKKWFGDSKIVDENGEPLVVDGCYVSTAIDFVGKYNELIGRANDVVARIRDIERASGTHFPNMEFMYADGADDVMGVLTNDNDVNALVESILNGEEPVVRLAFRYGDVPEGGRSLNYRDNERENGVSVVGRVADMNTRRSSYYETWFGDEPYNIVVGLDLGNRGADGEMLLTAPVVLCKAQDAGDVVKSATDNNGDFSRSNPDIRYAVSEDSRGRERTGEESRGKKADGVATRREAELRDALVEVMRQAGVPVVIDDAEGQRVLDAYRERVRAMGSKVNRRMSEIGQSLSGIEMTVAQRMVVDVFSGIKDNQHIDVERPDGSRHVIMRQGNERGAGAKHSVFRHYDTGTGVISAVDVLKIPEVIEKGNITEKRRGNVRLVEYRYTDENGTRYTVVTEVKKKGEVFNDFYTNKKASNQTPQMPNGDTPESARTNDNDANSGAKLQKVGDSASDGGEKVSSDVLFDGAKKKFGVTRDIREAGYVLPDGTMLDFSGRHELLGADDSGIRGRRTTDHRAVGQIGWMYDENGDEVETGLTTDMPDFIERGAIRIDCNAGTINLATAPTAAQRKVLRELIARNGGDVQVDFGNGWDSAHYAEYSEAKATRVLGDIERYFSEGVRPKGDIQFFRTEEGEVYGFVKDGVIYLDPKLADAETAIHEYGHLWGEALRAKNPAAWARLRGEMEADAELMAYVKSLYPELEGDALIDEVFQRYAGKRGAERLRAERDRMLGQADGILGKAGVVALFDKLRRLLERFWRMSRDLFAGVVDGLDRLSGADFADMMLADLLGGFNPNAAGARGEGLVAETGVADTFYSNAARAVENIKQNKAKAEQWKAMLTKAGGIKAGEDKWMGLTQWLDEHKGETLTKEQVLEFVRENGVKMVEREYIEAPYSFESLKREYDQWLHDEGFDYAQEQLLERFGDDADLAFDDLGGELVIANEEAAAALLGSEDIINSTRLDYTTEGLDNKREIAFVVPGVEPYQEGDAVHFGPENEGRAVMWVRFGETTDEDGNRVLVIDEIQSNRHQDAREKGYEDPALTERLKQIQQEIDAATKEFGDFNDTLRQKYGVSTNYTKIEKTREEWGWNHRLVPDEDVLTKEEAQKWKEGDEKIKALRDVKDKLLVDRMGQEGVPAAPFEKNWHEVAMKRMLRLAAEEGFDKVAWTTGEQQAERYNLGRAFDSIERGDNPNMRDRKRFVLSGANMETVEVNNEGMVVGSTLTGTIGKDLREVVGQSVAEKMMGLEDGDMLEGEDLRIGGEGMKGFYDQMLPRFMDKYGKKWGVKTGEVRLSTPGGEVMHSVDVTDAMRHSVLVEGQPLFQKAEDERGQQRTGEDVRYREDDAQAFHDVIDEMFDNEDFDRKAHARERYDLGVTPKWMKGVGISGERFTLSFKNIKTHLGKDADHNLTAKEWHELPSALKHPFLVTSYGNKDGKFRLYTTIKVGDKFAVVGVDVVRVNQGKGVPMLELNRIKTVFGRDRYVVENGERILAWDKNITPEQEALLRGHNYREYPTIQELSAAKVENKSDIAKENVEDVASEGPIVDERGRERSDEGGADYREVSDDELIAWLEKQPKMRKIYRSMVLIDGKLYPPMSSRESDTGALRHPEELGRWTESQERPDLSFYDEKTGKWYFRLVKSNGKQLGKVLYNPYIHTSTTMLNDQFKEAQSRPDLVVVEMEIPVSELDGVYRAEHAADPTGRKPWNAGVIQKYLTGTRDVILSRWAKPVRIVPNDEVARHIYDMIKGRIEVMPTNVVTPQVRAEMEKLGVKFVETDNRGNLVGGEHAGESWTDVYGKRNKKANRGKKAQRPDNTRAMHERAISLGEKLGVKVRLVESRSELPANWSDKQKRRRKGWFDPRTGEVVIVVPNNNNVADVEATVLHEIVGHKGLRELFGKDFDTFLDNVFNNVDAGTRSKIVERMHDNGWNVRKATEEYLASLAESTDFENEVSRSAWEKIKDLFMELLRKAGIRLGKPLTDADLRYVLWRSYQHRVEKGAMGVAEDVVMRESLGIDGGVRYREDEGESEGGDAGVRYTTARDRAVARDAYERIVRSAGSQFREAMQDSMQGLKALMKSILGSAWTNVDDVPMNENAYVGENLMSSVTAAQQQAFYTEFMKPLLEEVSNLCKTDAERDALTNYLLAKHGLERNLVFAERDAREAEDAGEDYNDAYAKFRERDYSGLTALTGEDSVAAAESAAQQMVDAYEANHDTSALWDKIRAATKVTLEKQYRAGMLSKESYDKISDMFEYYVPLRGFAETTSDEVYGYLTSSAGPFLGGSIIKHAEGRKSKADDPIATIAMMGDDSVRTANRNLMKRMFLNFVLNHPSDAVSVNGLWLQKDAVSGEWVPVFPKIPADATADKVEQILSQFEQDMATLSAQSPDDYKHGRDAVNIPYRVLPGNEREHQVLVKVGGRTYVLTINGNPRAAQALNGLTNPNVPIGGAAGFAVKAGEAWNRLLSALYTTFSPAFIVSNFLRDTAYSNQMVWVRESPNYALRFNKNYLRVNPIMMRVLFGKWESGTLDDSKPLEKHFKEFMLNGGETGYAMAQDINDYKKKLKKELRNYRRSAWLRGGGILFEQYELLGRAVENCARFAAYLTSREMGRSAMRSAYDAKEISVNFNKKGAGGKTFGMQGQSLVGNVGSLISGLGRILFTFWNAGVQGMANFGRGFKRHPFKAALLAAGPLVTMGALAPVIARLMGAGDGDDDDKDAYYNLPEYVRRSNVCIYIGGLADSVKGTWLEKFLHGTYLALPLPIEFRSLYGLGELTYGVVSGNERYSNEELAMQYASQFSQLLPIDMLEGSGGFHAFIPTFAKPYVEAEQNMSWSGTPIYRDSEWNKDDPQWTKAFSNANEYIVSGTEWLNAMSGGDEYKQGWWDWNPAKIEYMLRGYLGGLYTFPTEMLRFVGTVAGARDFEWRNVPLANRVLKQADERTELRKLKNDFYRMRGEAERTGKLEEKYQKAERGGKYDYDAKVKDLQGSQEYGRYLIYEDFKPLLAAVKDSRKGADEVSGKYLEDMERRLMRSMVDAIHAYDDGMKVDSRATSDKLLEEASQSGIAALSKKANDEQAKRLGGKDTYGSPDTEYGEIYLQKRDYFDRAEDVLLQSEWKKAKDSGDTERASAIDKARRELTTIKKGKHTKSANVPGLGEGDDDKVMEQLRARRKELLRELGITR